MKLHVFITTLMMTILTHLFKSSSVQDIHVGYKVTLAIPSEYTEGFIGRAFLMETEQTSPHFKAAISAEAMYYNRRYSCSIDIFLGDVRVWSSCHLSKFYATEKCVLELTEDGDLRLKGEDDIDVVGWRSGTSGQGVEKLSLLRTGNLVLVDALNLIKWQSFNFPTDIMLWGQKLSSQTRLISFPELNSTLLFYSLEIQYNRLALYLNLGKSKYSYWEYQPASTINRNITFVQLTSNGLEIFDGRTRFDLIKSDSSPPRFLSLENSTGNLRMYSYSDQKQKFESSYQALNFTCDLPLSCKPYGICTLSGSCSCMRLETQRGPDCFGGETIRGLCGKDRVEMIEVRGVASVLKSGVSYRSSGKDMCGGLCLDDCDCVAAQYEEEFNGSCSLYKMVRGIKQRDGEGLRLSSNVRFMVKVPQGTSGGGGSGKSSGLRLWVIIVVVVADVFVIFLVVLGVVCYVVRKRRKNISARGQGN